ncbi:MAG: glycosyltransferase family 39 protein [Lentisphaerae bacterium]|nr:glycosyltransferase family 39 protein [Lentisphaerota bacterium]
MLVGPAVLAAYVLVAAGTSLWDRDEPRYARATVEMIGSGDLLVPTFAGDLRPDKPILIYWLMAVPAALFGATELSFRIVAVCATAAAAFLTYLLGCRLCGRTTGLLAAGMLVTTPLMLVSGSAATTDAVLAAWIIASLLAFHELAFGTRPHRAALLMGLALGGAQLTKGPVGLAIPLLGAVAIGASRWREIRKGRALAGLLAAVTIGVALFLAWAIPANDATGGEFLRLGVGHHVLKRSISPLESHGGARILFLFYYLPVIFLMFFPWTLYLPGALSAAFGGRSMSRTSTGFVLGWTLPCLVLMSLVATKLPHYVLPCWPALAILAGSVVEAAEKGKLSPRDRAWLRRGRWLFAPAGLLFAAVVAAAAWIVPMPAARVPGLLAAGVLVVMVLGTLALHGRERYRAGVGVLLAGMIVFQLVLGVLLSPALESVKISRSLAGEVRALVPARVPIAMYGYTEPSLVFYMEPPGAAEIHEADHARAWLEEPRDGVLFVSRALLEKEGENSFPGREIASRRGYNFAKGQWVEVVAFRRRAG